MPIYRYQHESLVDTVHLLTNEKGGLRAYLYADDGKDTERLRMLKQALRAKGYECVPALYNDTPTLEVRGFTKGDELMGYLDELHALKGKPEVIAAEGDVRTRGQKLSSATLKMAGMSFNIGDAGYMFHTVGPVIDRFKETKSLKKAVGFFDIFNITAGVGYALGSMCLTFFGSKDQSINTIKSATSKIERFARKEGYQIAPESSISFVNHKTAHGVWGNIKDTIGRYPSESLNAIYVGVGVCMSAASLFHATRPIYTFKEFEALTKAKLTYPKGVAAAQKSLDSAIKWQQWDKVDVGLGVVTAASGVTGLAVKERKRMDGDPKRHGIGGFIDWVREKPLRATGYGYLLATGFHTAATMGKWKEANAREKFFLKGRVVFIVTNVMAELLMAISSKGHGIGVKPDSSVDESIISTAAELVLRQPPDKREAIISQLSGYIASPDVLATKADKIEASLREHMKKLDQNPWTKHYVATPTGEMVEVAPAPQATAPAEAIATPEPTAKPTNIVSNAEHVAKQQTLEHAVA